MCLFFVRGDLNWIHIFMHRPFYISVFVCLTFKVYQLNAGKTTPYPSSRFSTCRIILCVSRYGEFCLVISIGKDCQSRALNIECTGNLIPLWHTGENGAVSWFSETLCLLYSIYKGVFILKSWTNCLLILILLYW